MPPPLQQLLLPLPRPTLCSQDGAPSRLRLAAPHCRRATTPPPKRAAVLPLLLRRQANVLPLLSSAVTQLGPATSAASVGAPGAVPKARA